jgi:hypothetical protein
VFGAIFCTCVVVPLHNLKHGSLEFCAVKVTGLMCIAF